MNHVARVLLSAGLILFVVSGAGCSSDGDASPPAAEDIDIPKLSAADRELVAADDNAIPSFVAAAAALPDTPATCRQQILTVAHHSMRARNVARRLEDARLQRLLVNHSAAAWDYVRACAGGEPAAAVQEELSFYDRVLEKWLAE